MYLQPFWLFSFYLAAQIILQYNNTTQAVTLYKIKLFLLTLLAARAIIKILMATVSMCQVKILKELLLNVEMDHTATVSIGKEHARIMEG